MHKVLVKGILTNTNGINIYRGCTHGCIYCDSRSKCYGFSHPFEDVEVKQNAPQLLEKALRSRRERCVIGTGSMSDPYIPVENQLRMTRRCLELIRQYGFGVAVQTKSSQILRDTDLITDIHRRARATVQMTLTTYNEELCKKIEPNVSSTRERFEALLQFRKCNVPTVVWISPILPYINDQKENLQGILDYCIRADVKGIICFGMGMTLRQGNREYFFQKLDESFPEVKRLYLKNYGNAYELLSPNQSELEKLLNQTCEKHHIMLDHKKIFSWMGTIPRKFEQQSFLEI